MPIMEVTLLEGRDVNQKREFTAAVTEAAVETLGVAPSQVRIILREIPAAHFAVGGISKADAVSSTKKTRTSATKKPRLSEGDTNGTQRHITNGRSGGASDGHGRVAPTLRRSHGVARNDAGRQWQSLFQSLGRA